MALNFSDFHPVQQMTKIFSIWKRIVSEDIEWEGEDLERLLQCRLCIFVWHHYSG